MAKRTNRVAWGLILALAVLLLVSGVALVANYPHRIPGQPRRLGLLPPGKWKFGTDGFVMREGPKITLYQDCSFCGFFVVRIECSPPAKVRALVNRMQGPMPAKPSTPTRPPASTRRGTGR
jgi:hypothetical protein